MAVNVFVFNIVKFPSLPLPIIQRCDAHVEYRNPWYIDSGILE